MPTIEFTKDDFQKAINTASKNEHNYNILKQYAKIGNQLDWELKKRDAAEKIKNVFSNPYKAGGAVAAGLGGVAGLYGLYKFLKNRKIKNELDRCGYNKKCIKAVKEKYNISEGVDIDKLLVKNMINGLLIYETYKEDPNKSILTEGKKKDKKWIQKAIEKKGSLRTAASKAGKITSRGTIDSEWLRQQASKNTKTGKRARLALTLKKLKKK